jgi:hypothetical protein
MFGLFKKKKEPTEFLPPPTDVSAPTEEPKIEDQPSVESLPKPVEEKVEDVENKPLQETPELPEIKAPETDFSKIESELSSLESIMPKEAAPSKNATLENLCIKIDLEAEDIERRIKEFRTIVSKVSINSSEIFDLLDLYAKAKSKLKEFIQEIDRFDSVGWGVDEETAAFYKFKACKGLARIRKEMFEIEQLVKQSGFTPAKIEEILRTPAERLVDQLAKVKPQVEQKVKKVKKKR